MIIGSESFSKYEPHMDSIENSYVIPPGFGGTLLPDPIDTKNFGSCVCKLGTIKITGKAEFVSLPGGGSGIKITLVCYICSIPCGYSNWGDFDYNVPIECAGDSGVIYK